MTFSDPAVAKFVNDHFVAAWHNRAPGFHNDDYKAEDQIFQYSHEVYLTRNICTFFLSHEGRVFHYAAGSYAPGFYLEVLRTAAKLREAAFDADMALQPDGAELLARAHKVLASAKPAEGAWKPSAETSVCTYREKSHKHTAHCDHFVEEARDYFARVHQSLGAAASVPKLEDVRYKYLYGNSFTEESDGARPIERDPTLDKTK